jgi:hypothetical protein
MCRWLERDPAGYQDGPSLYSYLGRNPMAGTDPSGLQSEEEKSSAFNRGHAIGAATTVAGVVLVIACPWVGVPLMIVGIITTADAGISLNTAGGPERWSAEQTQTAGELAGGMAAGSALTPLLPFDDGFGGIPSALRDAANERVTRYSVQGKRGKSPDAAGSRTFVDDMSPLEAARYEKYWSHRKENPQQLRPQVTPGVRVVERYKRSLDGDEVYLSVEYYDEFGRFLGEDQYTTHGRDGHSVPHGHRYNPPDFFDRNFHRITNPETGTDLFPPGPYRPLSPRCF